MLVTVEKQSHWYYPNATPCFQVPRKDGNGMRDPTVRDARELGLLPSPTSILRVMSKPGLEAWKQEQAILAALTLPRKRENIEEWIYRAQPNTEPGRIATTRQWLAWAYHNPPKPLEDDQVFAAKVVEDAEAQASEAADFGRQIHKSIERWLLAKEVDQIESDVMPFIRSIVEWARTEIEEVYAAEKVVVNHHEGYAGTLDLYCKLRGIGDAVVDFKTQGWKPGKAPNFYDEWPMQLAAYGAAISRTKDREAAAGTQSPSVLHAVPQFPALVSVVINSAEPYPICCEQWKEPEKFWHLFKCAFELWKYQKGYDPVRP